MTEPLVSILMPAHNAGRFIEKALLSVQDQNVSDWELLVVDDCSEDDTSSIVEQFQCKDPRINLLRRAQKGGPGAARQTALAEAQGRYVAFLDSDDYWLPEKLASQLWYMNEMSAALSFTAFRRVAADGGNPGPLISVPATLTYAQLLKNTAIGNSTAIIDRSLTGPFEVKSYPRPDFVLWLDILKRGLVAHGLNEDLMRYRIVPGSVSSDFVRSAHGVWRVYREVEHLSLPYAAWCLAQYGARAAARRAFT